MRIARGLTATACFVGLMGLAAPAGAQELCTEPSFSPPSHSPLLLSQEAGMEAKAHALVSGRFFSRPAAERCDCDIAIAVKTQSSDDFLLIKRGNGDGTFLRAAMIATAKHPRAAIAGRFTSPGGAELDSIAVVTGFLQERGKVALYVPRERDGGIEYQRSDQGPWEVARDVRIGGVAAGHFNRDEHLDLAVAGDNEVRILFGNASGGFTIQTIALPQGKAMSLAAGKFTGTGDTTDIAIGFDLADGGNQRSAVIVASWSDQAAAMQAGAPLPVATSGSKGTLVKAADLSEPGMFRDLIVAYNRSTEVVENGALKLLTRQANGTLGGSAPELPIAGTPQFLALAKISADDIVDLVISTHGDSANANNGKVQILQGARASSGPTFKPWVGDVGGGRPRAVTAIKLKEAAPASNSGRTVLVAANTTTVSFYLGGGDGAFNEPAMVATQVPPEVNLVLASKLLANGVADASSALDDLVGSKKRTNNKHALSAWLSTGTGSFEEPLSHGTPVPPRPIGTMPTLMASGKLDGDGIADVVVVDTAPAEGGAPVMRTFKGNGDGTFAPLGAVTDIFLAAGEKPVAVAIAPFTGQGEAKPSDIAVISVGKATIWINEGDGRFRKGPVTPLNFVPRQVVATNKLRDPGKYDLVISNEQLHINEISPQEELLDVRRFTTWLNNGDGNFRQGVSILTRNRLDHMAVEDVDFDGFADVITVGERRTEGQFLFGTHMPDKIEPNRVKVYLNDQFEGFEEGVEESPSFDVPACKDVKLGHVFAVPFGERKIALAGFASRDVRDPVGFLLTAKPSLLFSAVGDGRGRFGPASCVNPNLPKKLPQAVVEESRATVNKPATLPEPFTMLDTGAALVGQFRNKLHGVRSPELLARGKLSVLEMDNGPCTGSQPLRQANIATTCEKLDPGSGFVNNETPFTNNNEPAIITFGSETLCGRGEVPVCGSELDRDGRCLGGPYVPEQGNCRCAPAVPPLLACQTRRDYGNLLITFASCMDR